MTTGKRAPVRLRPRRPCPICGKPSQQKFHPFCSARCADVDLHRWLGGSYAIPAEETGIEEIGTPDSESGENGSVERDDRKDERRDHQRGRDKRR